MTAQQAAPLAVREYFSAQRELYSEADARTIGPELERLAAGGATRASEIVDAARPDDAPLHPYFEWDDRRAAEGFRCMQAARMARTIVVKTVRDGRPAEEPAFRPIAVQVVRSAETTAPTADRAPTIDAPSTRGNVQFLHVAPSKLQNEPPDCHSGRDVDEEHPSALAPTERRRLMHHGAGPSEPSPRHEPPAPTADEWRQGVQRRSEPRPAGQSIASGAAPLPSRNNGAAEAVKQLVADHTVSKLPDGELISRAAARLLGFEATYGAERRRERFEAIFGPVFDAIAAAVERAEREVT